MLSVGERMNGGFRGRLVTSVKLGAAQVHRNQIVHPQSLIWHPGRRDQHALGAGDAGAEVALRMHYQAKRFRVVGGVDDLSP
jgi:uncharacterized protein involved in copper resistance